MFQRYPIHGLVEGRREQLGIARSELVRRFGFKNVAKGIRRLDALCDGDLASSSARMILAALPVALGVEAGEVEKAVQATATIIARAKAEEEARQEAASRASFKPSAFLLGTASRPSSITIYGLSGGAERWLKIPLDLSQSPITFARQALTVVRRTPTVPFFGATMGFIINYTPDRAVRFDIGGTPVEDFERAYVPGAVDIFIGKQRLSAKFPETP